MANDQTYVDDDDAMCISVVHALTDIRHLGCVRTGEKMRLSVEEFKSLPYSKLASLWKSYVSALGELLIKAKGDVECAAGQRVIALIEELRLVLSCVMSSNPRNFQSFRCAALLAHGLPDSAHDCRQASCSRSAQLKIIQPCLRVNTRVRHPSLLFLRMHCKAVKKAVKKAISKRSLSSMVSQLWQMNRRKRLQRILEGCRLLNPYPTWQPRGLQGTEDGPGRRAAQQ
jgi:hypothetical protein